MKINRYSLSKWIQKYGILFLLILSGFLLHLTALNISENVLWQSNGRRSDYSFPSRISSSENTEYYVYTGTINKSWYSQHFVRLIPDDRIFYLKLNGNMVPGYDIASCQSMNTQCAVTFPLAKHLTNGCNTIEIGISDPGKAWAGLSVRSSLKDPLFVILYSMFILSLGIIFCKILKFMGLSSKLAGIAVIPIIIGMLYFLYNEYWIRSHDVEGHLDYIRYIISSGHLPAKHALWMSYHPPLYFCSAVLFHSITKTLGIASLAVSCQILAMILFTVFISYSMLTINRLVKTAWGKIVAGLLFATLPANILHFPRIGNDNLLYALSGAVLFHIIAWHQDRQQRHILIATTLALVSLFVKSNGVILAATVLVALGLKMMTGTGKIRFIWATVLTCMTLLTAIAYNVSISNIGRPNNQIAEKPWVVGNISTLDENLKVGNSARNMLTFNAKTYFSKPFTNPWRDGYGRNFFPNYALKTFLFGEFSSDDPTQRKLAQVISILLLPLIAVSLIVFLKKNNICFERLVPTAYLVLSIAALFYLRYTVPFSCSGDARYIYPVSAAWTTMVGWGLDCHQTKNKIWIAWMISSIVLSFVGLSICLNLYPLHCIM